MKNIAYLFSLLLLLSCNTMDEEPGFETCPVTPTVFVFTVDYTTNEFRGGYMVALLARSESLDIACEYVSPSDFGSVVWYDKRRETRLFAGTTIWMGTGARTFPEKIDPAGQFETLDISRPMPPVIPLLHDEFDKSGEGVDYTPVWQAIANLRWVSWVRNDAPAYVYLYRPSVGVGNPKDWYWVVFLKN